VTRASHNSCVHLSILVRDRCALHTSPPLTHRPYVGGFPRLSSRTRVGPGDIVQRDGRAD
jgi:hypothetical protein